MAGETKTHTNTESERVSGGWRGRVCPERRALILLATATLIYMVLFSASTILNYYTYQSHNSYDLGIYMQSLWTTINGHGLFYTALWEGSRFVTHFEPILFVVLPLYAILPRAETLLVLQTVMLGLGTVPLFLLARARLGSATGLGFVVLYLMNPAVHGVNGSDFHAVALAVPLLLASHYCMSVGRLRAGIGFALVALTCRENVSLVVFLMALYWAWQWRRRDMWTVVNAYTQVERRFLVAVCLALVALIWLVLAVNVIIPHYAGSTVPPTFERYSNALANLEVDPQGRLLYLIQVMGPLGFLSLFAPSALIMSLPVFAQNLLSSLPHMYSIAHQNSALLIPWVFIAALNGMAGVVGSVDNDRSGLRFRLLAVLFVATSLFGLLYSNSPISVGRRVPVVNEHHQVVSEAIALLPEDAFVFTQYNLFPHICHRPKAYTTLFTFRVDFFRYDIFFPQTIVERTNGDFDYVLMDTKSPASLSRQLTPTASATLYSEYGLYAKGDGVYLFRRGFEGNAIELPVGGG